MQCDSCHLLDVGVEGGAVGAVHLVAPRLVPEVEVLLVVVAVDGGQSVANQRTLLTLLTNQRTVLPVGVPLPGVHGVLPQVLLLAAVLQQEQPEPATANVSSLIM